MCMVLGLDPCLYLKKESEINVEEKQIIISELVELFELSESENIKFLYNGFFDYNNIYGVKNLISDSCNDFAFIALQLTNRLEYIEIMHNHIENDANCICTFEEPIKGYILALFDHLYVNYHHKIIVSNKKTNINILERDYYFIKNILNNQEINIDYLPMINSYDDFINFFAIYNWFFGRDKEDIILTDYMKHQIKDLSHDQLFNILTSIFRGIYYPDYKLSMGESSCKYTIKAHSDSNIKYSKVNNVASTLFRIHCVTLDEMQGGVNRICYTKYDNKFFVFYYNEKHCNILKHEEEIENPIIIKCSENIIIQNRFELKIKK